MKEIKTKITTIFGAISTFFGGIGIVISELGLCVCFLAPVFSMLGFLSITMGFLSENKLYFLMVGSVLLIISFILYKKEHVCHIHKRK